MCLIIPENSQAQIATEDIVCYKRIIRGKKKIIIPTELHGNDFTAIMFDKIPIHGKLTFADNKCFLCSNSKLADGAECDVKHGYKYSWRVDIHVKEVTVNYVTYTPQDILMTPYRDFVIEIGKTYKSLIDRRMTRIEAAIHSFKYESSAKRDELSEDIVVQCVIPKGSTYYEGVFNDTKSYASDCLTYVEIVK